MRILLFRHGFAVRRRAGAGAAGLHRAAHAAVGGWRQCQSPISCAPPWPRPRTSSPQSDVYQNCLVGELEAAKTQAGTEGHAP